MEHRDFGIFETLVSLLALACVVGYHRRIRAPTVKCSPHAIAMRTFTGYFRRKYLYEVPCKDPSRPRILEIPPELKLKVFQYLDKPALRNYLLLSKVAFRDVVEFLYTAPVLRIPPLTQKHLEDRIESLPFASVCKVGPRTSVYTSFVRTLTVEAAAGSYGRGSNPAPELPSQVTSIVGRCISICENITSLTLRATSSHGRLHVLPQALLRSIERLQMLEALELEGWEMAYSKLTFSSGTHKSGLRTLTLRKCNLGLLREILQWRTTLRNLKLEVCSNLSSSRLLSVLDALSTTGESMKLEVLIYEPIEPSCAMDDHAVMRLVELLHGFPLTDGGSTEASDFVRPQSPIHTLSIPCGGLTDASSRALSHLPHLTHLTVLGARSTSMESASDSALESIVKGLPNLEFLKLQSLLLGPKASEALVEAGTTPKLNDLDQKKPLRVSLNRCAISIPTDGLWRAFGWRLEMQHCRILE
ncbi:hypothetical protein M427DRAFT_129851 [Gonapodya prolifera JEL478]|uniref:F-box domain-containing protein n=1 Tax=Gonapodya prolifera (strain JEL478) TaxID=1344416 RepID=A0A139AZU6_GONPJ|nr:hypothetical protein M427DRAFT_129851 [Gonapodya prolifera JEL478]|eukprot:KXS22083.1 hypothetical protein M427DRAFT_129851 [Gonapodya prolifera JEL478]